MLHQLTNKSSYRLEENTEEEESVEEAKEEAEDEEVELGEKEE